MFRWGTAEAKRRAVLDRHTVQEFGAGTVDEEAALRAVAAAVTAPSPRHSTPWRFVVVRREATRLLDAMMHAWIADLRADGLTDEQVRQRIRRGEVLRAAPLLIVPCLVTSGSAAAPSDERRATAVREMFLVSMGAALENLLVVLAADGLASAWLPSTLFCKQVVRDTLDLPDDWDPMGAVAVGPAAGPPPARPPHDPLDFVLER
jgi:coenzyme F420-0:L-glutamate ligase/coenzyme F420-1:gamma-L-glutamate ligase